MRTLGSRPDCRRFARGGVDANRTVSALPSGELVCFRPDCATFFDCTPLEVIYLRQGWAQMRTVRPQGVVAEFGSPSCSSVAASSPTVRDA